MHRREALRSMLAAAGLGLLETHDVDELVRFGERLHAAARAGVRGSGVLEPRLRAIVTIAAERIIPASDTPGATDANVTAFIEHMLAEWYDPADRDRVLSGLADVDARSRARAGREFVALDEPSQVTVLTELDAEAAAARQARVPGVPEHWFATFKFLVVWGYCTSEPAMRRTLGEWPLPGRYESCAPYAPSSEAGDA